MQVVHSEFTIAEYCDQMQERKIIVNREYQRSPGIWPPTARSYLIDTIILGFPIPKLFLYERTDIKSRTTVKEIVDGQQRSETILSFYLDEFRIGGQSSYSGRTFSDLKEEDQTRFLTYRLCADTFVGATVHEIREVFRRINSYTVPLNSQEQRHARFQGAFKWFMVDLTERYSQVLKDIGVFSESQLLRMADAELLTEVIMALEMGILSASKAKIDKFYYDHEEGFPTLDQASARMDTAFARMLRWVQVHRTALMKSYNFSSLSCMRWILCLP